MSSVIEQGVEAVDNILIHFGIKGMKWGVRRARKRVEKLDRRANAPKTKVSLHNAVHEQTNAQIARINKKPEYAKAIRNKTLLDDSHPTTQKYLREIGDSYVKEINNEIKRRSAGSPSGTRQYKAYVTNDFLGFTVLPVEEATHADSSFKVKFVKDENGMVVDLVIDNEISQSEPMVDHILTHFGVKGMKWGVRKSRPSAVTVSDKRKKLKTSGGHGRPASSDAVRARTLGQVGKKSGLKALSDQELQAYARRLQLEQSVKRLEYGEKNVAKRFVLSVLGQSGKQTANELTNVGTRKVAKTLAARMAIAAA